MILFRGQTRRKGEKVNMAGEPVPSNWVYGGVFKPNDDTAFAIIYSYEDCQKYAVYNNTVGMFSGVKDIKCNNVFEGDIVKSSWYRGNIGIVKYGQYKQDGSSGEYRPTECLGWYVHFSEDECWFGEQDESLLNVRNCVKHNGDNEFEVIGNIYDNPEMIKE